MLKIRLTRGGTKKRPYYSVVVADSHSPRDGRFIEKVGTYNPLLKKEDPNRITLKSERIAEWLGKGAQPTDRVARFLSTQGLAKWAPGNNPKKAEPHAKAKERAAARAERAELAAAAPPPEPAAEEPAEEATEAAAAATAAELTEYEEAPAPEAEAAAPESAAETPAAEPAEEAPAGEEPASEG